MRATTRKEKPRKNKVQSPHAPEDSDTDEDDCSQCSAITSSTTMTSASTRSTVSDRLYSHSTQASLNNSKSKSPKNDVKTRFSTSKQTNRDSSKSNLPKNEIKNRFSTDRDSKITSMLRHSLSTPGLNNHIMELEKRPPRSQSFPLDSMVIEATKVTKSIRSTVIEASRVSKTISSVATVEKMNGNTATDLKEEKMQLLSRCTHQDEELESLRDELEAKHKEYLQKIQQMTEAHALTVSTLENRIHMLSLELESLREENISREREHSHYIADVTLDLDNDEDVINALKLEIEILHSQKTKLVNELGQSKSREETLRKSISSKG